MLLDSVTETVYGYPYLHIHRADYHKILVDEVNRLGVRIQLNSAVTGIDFETPSVHIKGHPDMVADIIIGADGLKSVCRESLLRHPDPPHITGDLAYRLVIKGEDIRKHPVLSSLTERLSVTYWIGPGVHVIGYLLRGGQLYNVVIACPDNLPEHVNVTKADIHELQDLLRGWDPQLLALLEIVQETSKWRLQNSEEMKVWSHPSGKFVLLGDACHATLPYL
jgi:salicylate hydroxylase